MVRRGWFGRAGGGLFDNALGLFGCWFPGVVGEVLMVGCAFSCGRFLVWAFVPCRLVCWVALLFLGSGCWRFPACGLMLAVLVLAIVGAGCYFGSGYWWLILGGVGLPGGVCALLFLVVVLLVGAFSCGRFLVRAFVLWFARLLLCPSWRCSCVGDCGRGIVPCHGGRCVLVACCLVLVVGGVLSLRVRFFAFLCVFVGGFCQTRCVAF